MQDTALSDSALVSSLQAICAEGNRLTARLLVHLIEVEDRRLDRKVACTSLFDFCRRKLGMSDGAAFRRINAARLVRKFPRLLGPIERGEIHLSSLVLVRDLLSEDNLDAILSEARGMTKRQVEELVARRAPRPDVPATIRKLPEPAGRPGPFAARTTRTDTFAPPSPSPTIEPRTLLAPLPAPAAAAAPAKPARIEPLAEARYRVQLTASKELRDKIERATDLLRHANPGGDLAIVLERALDALIEKLERDRLAKTSRPQRARRPAKEGRIPSAVRREVFERDGERCTFVSEEGERCAARAFLELDHIHARALGGAADAANLRVRCRLHNQLHAEEVFGRAHVARRIDLRQQKRTPASVPPLTRAQEGRCAHASTE